MTASRLAGCHAAYLALRQEMDAWLAQTVRLDPPGAQGGGEDEANYALAWFPHFLVTGSTAVKAHFEDLVDQLDGWVRRDCVHGYEPEAEAHHGTEPFLLFLPRFLGLFPEHETAKRLLADAAEHIGNWVSDVPSWFDWERNRFHGYEIGTRKVTRGGDQACELAEHFRFIHIALAAHRVLGEDRCFDWALSYGRRRAQMIADIPEGPLPVMWSPEGRPLWESDLSDAQARMSGASHRVAGDPLAGVEVLLASGAIYTLGDLFEATGDEVFRDAAKRIVTPLVDGLPDPYCDPGAAAISYYRVAFKDNGLDDAIRAKIDAFPDEETGELAMIFPEHRKRAWTGVGKRADMTFWGVWDEATGDTRATREPCTAALTLAYQLTGEVDYAKRAFSQAARKLSMARRVLRGGREHSDMGGAVCSVAAGHGRNWGWGAVTGCYGPLLLGTRVIKSKVTPSLHVRDDQKRHRLPESVLSISRPAGKSRFFNGGDEPVTFSWHVVGEEPREEMLEPGEAIEA